VPAGWSSEPPGTSEIDVLILDAPSSYTHAPTRIALESFIGTVAGQTPDEVASQWYGSQPGGNPEFAAQLVGQVMDCTVGGDQAAVFQYTSQRSQLVSVTGPGPFAGYMVIFLHAQFAFALRVEGTNCLDPRAIRDAKSILGSWTWT
jgi:hypothetical protein